LRIRVLSLCPLNAATRGDTPVVMENGMRNSLENMGEFGFIKKVTRGCLIRRDAVVKAIGDDAAAFDTAAGELTLVTTDLLVEHVHFFRDATSGFNLGYKSLAVNLSDIAAMGGTAREAFVGIAIPEDCDLDYLEELYRGIKYLAAEYDVNVLGGDTSGSPEHLVISITVIGTVPPNEMLCRDGAKADDKICVTGCLGDSRAGLHLILDGIDPVTDDLKRLFNAHVLPRPFLMEGRFLSAQKGVHAAIDLSDGLASDLEHIAVSSHLGARVYTAQLPISESLRWFCETHGRDPVTYATTGGEDYLLLFTLSPDRLERVSRNYRERFGCPFHVIGEMTTASGMEIVGPDGDSRRLKPGGWVHLQSKAGGGPDG